MSDCNPKVFVLDDDPDARASVVALVSSLGLAAEPYGSGPELLRELDVNQAGCAIVDFHLGGMDGLEVQRQLRHMGCQLPVILISAYLNVRKTAQALEDGVFRVVEKPYHNDELTKAIQAALEHDQETRRRTAFQRNFSQRLTSLDTRERLTLELLVAGQPSKVVERRLGLSTRTVDRIRASILTKMHFSSFMELAAAYGAAQATHSVDALSAF